MLRWIRSNLNLENFAGKEDNFQTGRQLRPQCPLRPEEVPYHSERTTGLDKQMIEEHFGQQRTQGVVLLSLWLGGAI